ncbi:MAG: tetratricopeptide repeat protein [Acidobacteria bacterium]|nr:tetratricopeptide repeat protein [Acidobacteriota bacterium]
MRIWLFRLVLVAIPVGFFALLETALRLSGAGFDPRFFVPANGGLVTNDHFGRRFFPRALVRTPLPLTVAVPKPAGHYRVILLGESAAMGFPEPAYGVGRMLEVLLERRMRAQRVEVINASMTAINSHVLVEIAAECAGLQPDAFVVVMGNNEVVGPRGPGSVFGGLASAVRTLRIGQVMADFAADRPPATEWRGMEMFTEHQVAAADPRLDSVYAGFRANLGRIAATGRSVGAKVVVSTVPVNLKDQPPFAGSDAEAGFASGDFRRARDLDRLRFRADSRINAAIREVAGAELVDAEQQFGTPGFDLFYEHVHLRPAGNLRLALLLAGALTPGPEMSLDEMKQILAITPWDEHQLESLMAALRSRPPFRGAVMPPGPAPDPGPSRAIYEDALSRRPLDQALRLRYAEFLRATGRSAEAAAMLEALSREIPGKKAIHAALGSAWTGARDTARAQMEFDRALALDPRFDLAWYGKSLAFAVAGARTDARSALDQALRINPGFPEARHRLGLLLAESGELDPAIKEFEAARRSDPLMADAHYDLGVLLAKQGKFTQAVECYRAAIRIRPTAAAYNNLGIALARSGNRAEAEQAFRKAVAIDPDHAASDNLKRLTGPR